MATDPVCGMTVDEKSAVGSASHAGQMYYFCSARCLSQSRANPAQFVGTSNPAASAHAHAHGETMAAPAPPGKAGKAIAKDPICGMLVDKASALKSKRAGRAYYFCSTGCQRTFESPEQELKSGGRFIVADFYRPANPLWWLVAWPFLFMPMTADNFRGTLPDYFREAGF